MTSWRTRNSNLSPVPSRRSDEHGYEKRDEWLVGSSFAEGLVSLAFALFTILILGVWELYRADAPYAIRVSRLLGIFLAFLSLAVTALVTAYFNTRDLLAD